MVIQLAIEESWVWFITALFNNMQTLKFKAQPTNAFFATVNQMLGGSSQLLTTAEPAVIKSNRWAQFRQHSRKAAEQLIDGIQIKHAFHPEVMSFSFEVKRLTEKRWVAHWRPVLNTCIWSPTPDFWLPCRPVSHNFKPCNVCFFSHKWQIPLLPSTVKHL